MQRSFDSDNEALLGGYATHLQRHPHRGLFAAQRARGPSAGRRTPDFFTATYSAHKLTACFTSAFASRSDDSTYLAYADQTEATACSCPTAISITATQSSIWAAATSSHRWLGVYGQTENLTNNQHIAPIGYASLPTTVRAGLRIQWGKGSGR